MGNRRELRIDVKKTEDRGRGYYPAILHRSRTFGLVPVIPALFYIALIYG